MREEAVIGERLDYGSPVTRLTEDPASMVPLFGSFTSRLLDKLGSLRWSCLDQSTREAALRHLLDAVALIYAGSGERVFQIAGASLSGIRQMGELPVPGSSRRHDLLDATYMMAIASHSLDYDDGYRAGAAHPGCIVVPAALAACAREGASGHALLEAVIAGYEVMTSVTRAAHPSLRGRGFHATAAAGVFAAAAAAGRILGLDERQQRSAFGLAASSAGGLFAFVQGGEDVKPLHVGHAAREGVFAALLAKQGAVGPPQGLEGHKGFFAVLADLPNIPGAIIEQHWGITDCYIKPWPGCRHLHPAIDAVLRLRSEHEFTGDDVDAVDVETYQVAAERAVQPWTSMASALLSFPFVLSTAILFGDVRLEHFVDTARSNVDIETMAQRLTVRASESMNTRYRDANPAKVSILLKDGRRLEREVESALGAPAMPLSGDMLSEKFVKLVARVAGPVCTLRLHAAWKDVVNVGDLADLMGLPLVE